MAKTTIPHYAQIFGTANIGDNNSILFTSEEAVPDSSPKFRCRGIVQCMSDGSFDFEPTTPYKSKSVRIKKLAHGSISATHDGAILLWVKVYKDEGVKIADTILDEAVTATSALTI